MRSRRRRRSGRPPRLDTLLMLMATCSTGMIDAFGYILLDGVLPANMTGNLVIAGIASSSSDGVAPGPIVAIAAFFTGAWTAGRVFGLRGTKAWSFRLVAAFGGVAFLVALAGCALAVIEAVRAPTAPEQTAVAAVLGLAMGLQAAAARTVGIPELNTVVITLPLVALGFEGIARSPRASQLLRIVSIGAIAAGAVGGGMAAHAFGGLGLLVPAGLLLVTAVAGIWRLLHLRT